MILLVKRAGKIREVGKAARQRDLRDRRFFIPQTVRGGLQAIVFKILRK